MLQDAASFAYDKFPDATVSNTLHHSPMLQDVAGVADDKFSRANVINGMLSRRSTLQDFTSVVGEEFQSKFHQFVIRSMSFDVAGLHTCCR